MSDPWTAAQWAAHIRDDCGSPVEVTSLGDVRRSFLCGCYETAEHTVWAAAQREVETEAPSLWGLL